jgi:Rps23 Pro-64 3,4-dihydroxylase Tpa1-like proline 4-hydroxylase
MLRGEIATCVVGRLGAALPDLRAQWQGARRIGHCVLDDVLPTELALQIRNAFPPGSGMKTRRSLRELKHVAAQMNLYAPILEDALYAFQDPRVVDLIARITGLRALEPDQMLYAGGISMMCQGHFLNPHIDNSHDKNRERYRVLNLLYYVSPDWKLENGGNLELWPDGVEGKQITVESRFNRLVMMVTNQTSWHSVSPVAAADQRCCLSNYYFSRFPADVSDYFHVTSFRGRPEQPLRDLVLQADAVLRMGLRRLFPKGAVKTRHFYDRSGNGRN